jgi:hypothetical protein
MIFDTEHDYLTADDCRLADLTDLVNFETNLADYPYASAVEQNDRIWNALVKLARRAPGVFADYYANDSRAARYPALFHAAGANRTAGSRRMANLLQVSSAFGRAMEAVDRSAMTVALSPVLQAMAGDGAPPAAIANVIAACAEGYPFPASLDLDQPVDGLAPPTQADILTRAVAERWSRQQLEAELSAWSSRRSS